MKKMYKTVNWNTGSAAARFRLKNKKRNKLQASRTKRQASSIKPRPDYLRLKKKIKKHLTPTKSYYIR